MQGVSSRRRRNLLLLIAEFSNREISQGRTGSAISFAQAVDIHPSLLSKLRGSPDVGERRDARDVSDKLARQIEARLGLMEGWLDQDHADAPLTSAEASFVDLALRAYRAAPAATRRELRKRLNDLVKSACV